MSELVIRNARVMTCDPARAGLGMIECGAIAVRNGTIAWIGDDDAWPTTALALGFPVSEGERTRRKP